MVGVAVISQNGRRFHRRAEIWPRDKGLADFILRAETLVNSRHAWLSASILIGHVRIEFAANFVLRLTLPVNAKLVDWGAARAVHQ